MKTRAILTLLSLFTRRAPGMIKRLRAAVRRVRVRLGQLCDLRSLIVECETSRCRRFHLRHSLLVRDPGIYLDHTWYCGRACLRDAMHLRLGIAAAGSTVRGAAPLASAAREPFAPAGRRPPRVPYRLILLDRGVVSGDQLDHARSLIVAPTPGAPALMDLGEALIYLGSASAEQVGSARAAEAGCAFYAGETQPVPPSQSIALSLVRRYHALPVHYAEPGGRLLVGFVYRVDRELLVAIEQATGSRAEACVITRAAFDAGLERLLSDAIVPERIAAVVSAEGAAAVLLDQLAASQAARIRIGRCRSTLWARLTAPSGLLDLLLDLERPLHQRPGSDRLGAFAWREARPRLSASRPAVIRVRSGRTATALLGAAAPVAWPGLVTPERK